MRHISHKHLNFTIHLLRNLSIHRLSLHIEIANRNRDITFILTRPQIDETPVLDIIVVVVCVDDFDDEAD